MSFNGHEYSFLLGIYLGVELLDYRVSKCLASGNTAWIFSEEAVPVYTLTSSSGEFSLCHRLASHIVKANILTLRLQEGGGRLGGKGNITFVPLPEPLSPSPTLAT